MNFPLFKVEKPTTPEILGIGNSELQYRVDLSNPKSKGSQARGR